MLSWVTTAYALKVLWAPLVDRMPLPILSAIFGQRRSWMLFAQAGVITGLCLMSFNDPQHSLTVFVLCALLVAFSSATQDIVIDAWRIEAVDVSKQGAMAGTYQLGYRLGMLMAGAGALSIAHYYDWQTAYLAMGVCMIIGVITALLIAEPEHRTTDETWRMEQRVVDFLAIETKSPTWFRNFRAWMIGAIVCPFIEFFQRSGKFALIILALIGLFRISDITMGVMANPFYIDLGFNKLEIAKVTKVYGVIMTIVGALFGGVIVARFNLYRLLFASALLVVLTNLLFAGLAQHGLPNLNWLIAIVGADNFTGGLAGSVFIAYLSGLTNRAYTATQYALFSSLMLMPGKSIGGLAGFVVEGYGYANFFIYAALLGLPVILVILFLSRIEKKFVAESQ